MHQFHENILLLFIPIICESNSFTSNEPLWNWECVNEICIQSKASKSHDAKPQSLETCSMLCSVALLWPLPTGQFSLATSAVPVSSALFELELALVPTTLVRQYLRDAFQLFKQELRMMEGKAGGSGEPYSVIVRITVNGSGDADMRLNTDESYQLSLEPVGPPTLTLISDIVAHSFCGARHALETLSQLVWLDHYNGSLLMIREAIVGDKPKFGYRGLMIDTARNHIPFGELMRTVDAMAASKLNTLHWHVSDSQGFSLYLNSVPQLAWYGANSPSHFYTSDQVKALVHRARLRGIRVLIEVDMPAHVGHAWNWITENPVDLVHCIDTEPYKLYCEDPPCGQLNPLNPLVLDTLQNIYSEIIQLTGVRDMFHIGGDDVSDNCWAKHYNGSDLIEIWLEFTRSALQRLEHVNGKSPNLTLFWSSRLFDYVKTDLADLSHLIGLQMRNATWLSKYISGLRTVVSHEDVWDLNSGYGSWHEDKSKIPFNSWQRFYEHRPWVKSGNSIIEGGEATLWSWVVGEGGLDARLWPRAAALAERLWTDRPEGATRTVHTRLDRHRARLAVRGVKCAPLWSYWCTQNPNTCS